MARRATRHRRSNGESEASQRCVFTSPLPPPHPTPPPRACVVPTRLPAPAVESELLEPVGVQRDVGGPVGVEGVAAGHLVGRRVAVVERLVGQVVVAQLHLVALAKGHVVVLSGRGGAFGGGCGYRARRGGWLWGCALGEPPGRGARVRLAADGGSRAGPECRPFCSPRCFSNNMPPGPRQLQSGLGASLGRAGHGGPTERGGPCTPRGARDSAVASVPGEPRRSAAPPCG